MKNGSPHRVLLYSTDNAGIGHSSIGIALLSALRNVYQHIELLVISSTGVPQRFLAHGIEIVKIPSLEPFHHNGRASLPYRPRYLENTSLQSCMQLRQEIIDAVFKVYAPTVLFIDHHITGLNGELAPWLLKKQQGYCDFKCAFLSRGIISGMVVMNPPFERASRGIKTIDLADSFESFFVFEERENLDDSFFNLSQLDNLQDKVTFVGKIAIKRREDLLSRQEVWRYLDLPDKELILVNLGHGLASEKILANVVATFRRQELHHSHVLLVAASPYSSREQLARLQARYNGSSVIISGFLDQFPDAMNHADLVICRGGYNTVTELLLTGSPAIVIPEDYGSGEQAIRAGRLPAEGFRVVMPNEIDIDTLSVAFHSLLNGPRREPVEFDSRKTTETLMSILIPGDKQLDAKIP